MQRLSAGSGLDIGALLPLLAMFLPQIIEHADAKRTVPDGGLNQAARSAPTSAACWAGCSGAPEARPEPAVLDDLIGEPWAA